LSAAIILLFLTGYAVFFLTGVATMRHLVDNLVAGYLIAWGLYAMLSDQSRTELGRRFILTTCTLLACLFIAEATVLLGIVDYRRVFNTFDFKHALSIAGRRFDPELLWRRDPYYKFEADYVGNLGRGLCMPPDPSKRVSVQYDHNGFRNDRDMTQADIVVIGDSYVESPMTPDAALSTTILAKLSGLSVANLGNSGYGPPQELAVFKRFGLPLHPKTVIWTFYEGNDISDMKAYEINMSAISGESPFWQDFWFRSLTRNLLALYFRSVPQTCVPSARIQPYWAQFTDRTQAVTPVFFAPPDDLDSFPSEADLRGAARYIAEAARLCRDRGIRFIVVFAPDKYRVYSNLSNVMFGTEQIRSFKIDDFPTRLEAVLRAMMPEIEYVDLTPALRAESRGGIPTYLSDDTHWSFEGHRVVAEEMRRAVESAGLPGPIQKAQR
jgi:hypothetical protein